MEDIHKHNSQAIASWLKHPDFAVHAKHRLDIEFNHKPSFENTELGEEQYIASFVLGFGQNTARQMISNKIERVFNIAFDTRADSTIDIKINEPSSISINIPKKFRLQKANNDQSLQQALQANADSYKNVSKPELQR